MKKAKDAGIGWVVAKGSNHFGIAGYYSLRALEQGFLVGLVLYFPLFSLISSGNGVHKHLSNLLSHTIG